jgi:LCP family protein required for cell wall assembly
MRYGSRRDDPDDWGTGRDEPAFARGQDDWDEAGRRRRGGQESPNGRQGPAGRRQAGPRGRKQEPRSSRRTASSGRTSMGRPPRGTGSWAQFRAKSLLARLGYAFVAVSAALAVGISITAYAVVYKFEGNITKDRVGGLSGKTVYGALNILVLGSQERAGQKGFFGYEANPGTTNSDNLLLVHLDPTHTHATVLSIPRDLFTYEPACKERSYIGTSTWPAQAYPPGAIIDGALNIGGPTCAVETVEALTGVKLDHVIVFDFNSFRSMVDALGGVTVCVPPGPGYHDGYSHLNLSPGLHKLKYDDALAYVRTRHGVGSGVDAGGDLPRIQLQQAFISSVAQEVEHENLFGNFSSLLRVANIATKALTVDDSLGSVDALLTLAKSLVRLKSKNINLITLPTTMDTYPGLSAHLMAVQPQDDVLYQMIRTGQLWHGSLPAQAPDKVTVNVENGTGQTGLAKKTATALRKLGFQVGSIGDAAYTPTTTVNFAGETQADGAYTLMQALKSFPAGDNTLTEPASQVGTAGAITLVLGADFTGVNPPAPKTAKSKAGKGTGHDSAAGGTIASSGTTGPGAIQSRNAGANICSGLPPAYTPGAQGPP